MIFFNILLFVKVGIWRRKLNYVEVDSIGCFYVEDWLKKIISNSNNLNSALSKSTDLYTFKYDHLLFMGDFNPGLEDLSIKNFWNSFDLTSLLNKPTWFKNLNRTSYVDLILTSFPHTFQNSCIIVTGLCNLHGMVVTPMKTSFHWIKLKSTC